MFTRQVALSNVVMQSYKVSVDQVRMLIIQLFILTV